MLEGLEGRTGSTVILDAGIASEENIQYLIEHGYKYIVVSRKRKRDFDEEKATLIKDIPGQSVKVQKVIVEGTGEVELYCHSQLREKKEQAMQDSFLEKQARHATSQHSGTPVTNIHSPTQRMGDALVALRPSQLRTKPCSVKTTSNGWTAIRNAILASLARY
ncbi:hypothetical protein BMR08_13285 [Methylococcaceae bacterium CS2]|nr:hypothetical protein BMR08_13285 [Methylococcaceae bacterium CS2]